MHSEYKNTDRSKINEWGKYAMKTVSIKKAEVTVVIPDF